MAIKISAGVVVTANARMDIWRPGYVVARDGRIAEAGPGRGPEGDFDETIDDPSLILMPGLVNGHAHSPSNLLKGTWAKYPLEIWRQYIRAGWREYSDEAIYVSAQLGIAEMIRTGCTAVMDHFYTGSSSPHMGALHAAAAMADAGMRGAIALTLSDRNYEASVGIDINSVSREASEEMRRISKFDGAETLDGFLDFAQSLSKISNIVTPIVGPSAPHRCSDDLLARCMRLAVDRDYMIHMHVCETKGQFIQGKALFGETVVAHLDKIGLLNDRVSMAHCVYFTDDDIRRVAEKGAIVIHNPASNGKLGSGRMRFDDMLRAGVRVGLATDGSGSNDTQNMFEAMRFAGAWHNRADRDYRDWPAPEDVLRAATSGSARALGRGDKLGVIAAGCLADIVLLTTNSYHFTPLNNVVNQIVYCENGFSVTHVMIDGRWTLKDREFTTIDVAALYSRAKSLRQEMDDRLAEQFRRTDPLEDSLRANYLESARTPWSDADGC